MDEFLGCSDKVRPKYVKQTQVLEIKENRESEILDKEKEPKNLAVVESCKDSAGTSGEENVSHQRVRKRRRRQEEGQISESDKALFNLLQAQQESIRQSEERDKEAFQEMMNFKPSQNVDTKNLWCLFWESLVTFFLLKTILIKNVET